MTDTFAFAETLSDDQITITSSLENNILNFVRMNNKLGNFSIKMQIDGSNMKITKVDESVNSRLLFGIIKFDEYTSINQFYDLIDKMKSVIAQITNFCIGCFEKIEFQSDIYVTCGKDECNYIYEELHVGNPVMDKIKDDENIVRFLLESALDAITCSRNYDIFEPFPKHFMKQPRIKKNINIKRGELSKLKGQDIDDLKDFNRLINLVKDFDITNFFTQADTCYDDQELAKMIGPDMYMLIRFIITSCKVEIVKDNDLLKFKDKNLYVYKIIHPIDKENAFKELSNDKVSYLFHGSRWCNWYSILRNGLKNCSDTKLMTAGAAYGNGIYLSDNFQISAGYGCNILTRNGDKNSTVGVFEIIGNKKEYEKSSGIYVVDNERVLKQCYLIIFRHTLTNKIVAEINSLFDSHIHTQNSKTKTGILSKGIKKLAIEYKIIKRQNPDVLGFRIETDISNIYLWKVFIFGYDKSEPIGRDMIRYDIKEIEIEVKFPETYPFSPPFLRVIRPRFQHLTGHVTQAGAICMQILTEKYWDPACSMESLIITFKSEILEGEGRLDPQRYNVPYSESEARDSFVRVARGHGWI